MYTSTSSNGKRHTRWLNKLRLPVPLSQPIKILSFFSKFWNQKLSSPFEPQPRNLSRTISWAVIWSKIYQSEQKIGKVNKWILFFCGLKQKTTPFYILSGWLIVRPHPLWQNLLLLLISYLARIRSWTRQSHPTKTPHKGKKLLLSNGLEFPDRDARTPFILLTPATSWSLPSATSSTPVSYGVSFLSQIAATSIAETEKT